MLTDSIAMKISINLGLGMWFRGTECVRLLGSILSIEKTKQTYKLDLVQVQEVSVTYS